METKILRTRYGRPATAALAGVIGEAKAGDPLAPVTVVVPDHTLGLTVRRQLAANASGLAAVDFVTLLDLARRISAGSPQISSRRPVSDAVVLAATRRLLAERPGAFGPVADHPSVERTVMAAHRNLREVHPEALDRLSAIGSPLADLVDLHRSLVERLEPAFHDEHERAVVAAARIADGTTDLPPVILHFPGALVASERRLLGALAAYGHLTAIVGDADGPDGSVSADPHLAALAETLGLEVPEVGPAGSRVACTVASTPEQDEAVRYAIRRIVEAARAGTPLDRIVLVHPSSTDDARLVQERLAAAGIEFHASGVNRLDETIAGRFLGGLLGLPDRSIRRADLDALMADVPLWDPDHALVPARAWARLATRAGVVGGIDDWTHRLARLAAELDAEAEDEAGGEGRTWLVGRLSAEATRARDLAAFVERLDGSLDDLDADASWSGRCRRVRELLRQYLGGSAAHQEWPADELLGLDEVGAVLDALSELDGVEPDPALRSFRGALAAELRRPLGRAGRTGVGVQVTSIDRAVGLDADLVIVVGLAEGSMPTRPPADPLLSDSHRTAAGTGLPTRHEYAAHQHHAFLAALTSAAERIVLIQPRGDLRRSGDRPMSRLLLAEFEALAGHRPEPDDLDRFTAPWFDHVASFTDALDHDDPATAQEYDLAAVVRDGRTAIVDLRTDDPVVDRGIEILHGRAGSEFTRFDGNLSGVALHALDRELSATRLEKWVKCPFAFFAEYVLGVRPLEEPSERTDLAPLVRGSIVHRVLDRLVTEGLDDGSLPGNGGPWTYSHRTRAGVLLTDECDHAEARGEAAHPRFWPTIRARLAAELDDFLVLDSAFRAQFASRPIAAERRFGGGDALVVTLVDGRSLRFRGSIDRVDLTADDGLVVVDAKTGSPDRYKNISDDHFPGGSFLQLPIYALAAAMDGRTTRHATYAFLGEVADGARHLGYGIDDEVMAAFRRVLTSIVGGIDGGAFPHHPPESDRPEAHRCPHCSPDGLDARRVRTARARKAADPVLALHEDHLTTDFFTDVGSETTVGSEPTIGGDTEAAR
jgi:RecB family exonuclease